VCLQKRRSHNGNWTIGFWKFEFESYRTELGYMLKRKFQGNGYMSEAIRRVLQYAFNELNLHSVEARVDSENISSLKVLEKIGFAREGYLKECSFNKGQFRDNVIFSLLRQNYS
jgi:ribosomal-protein-alanine N-acetyltransferase